CIMGPILVLLAVIVANQVLLGRKVLPVRCKGINISATSAAINLSIVGAIPFQSPQPHLLEDSKGHAARSDNKRPGYRLLWVGWDGV
uniref:Uncharacterized protein n=1 Tax=Xenopus tropicalis TaxID=8364 RepID=A0A6I8S739_XENTR